MSDHLSTQQLISQIEKKDRRFRTAQSIFMALLMVTLICLVTLVFKTLNSVEEQLVGQKGIINEIKREEADQLAKITRRLDCMVVFFSTPERQNLTIENVENCALNRNEDIDQFFQQPESTPSEQPPNLEDSAPTATQENDEAQNPSPQPEQQPEEPPVIEPRPPVIPLPLIDTNICLLEILCIE